MTHTTRWLGLTGLLFALGTLTTQADTLANAQTRYKEEMAECARLTSDEELKTCRLEARNALAEAKRNRLDDDPAPSIQSNASKRCDAHMGEDRMACEARMRGEGSTQGSVQEGGILREIVRPVPNQSNKPAL